MNSTKIIAPKWGLVKHSFGPCVLHFEGVGDRMEPVSRPKIASSPPTDAPARRGAGPERTARRRRLRREDPGARRALEEGARSWRRSAGRPACGCPARPGPHAVAEAAGAPAAAKAATRARSRRSSPRAPAAVPSAIRGEPPPAGPSARRSWGPGPRSRPSGATATAAAGRAPVCARGRTRSRRPGRRRRRRRACPRHGGAGASRPPSRGGPHPKR